MAEITIGGHFHSAPKTDANVRTRREKEGRCADCGMHTHRIEKKILPRRNEKIPLTIEGQVLRGRCLLCNPLPSPSRQVNPHSTSEGQSHNNQHIPSVVSFENSHTTFSDRAIIGDRPDSPSTITLSLATSKKSTSKFMTEPPSKRSTYSSLPSSELISYSSSSCSSSTIESDIEILSYTSDTQEAFQVCDRLNRSCMNPYNYDMKIIMAGGIPVIIAAMNHFKNSSSVQNRGIQALGQLSHHGSHSLMKHGGVHAVIRGMQLFPNDNLAAGMFALKTMASADMKLYTNIEFMDEIIPLMKASNQNADAAKSAVIVIQTLVRQHIKDGLNDAWIVKETKVISVILSLIQNHTCDPYFLEEAFYTIAQIARRKSNTKLLIEYGAIEEMNNVLRTLPTKSVWSRVAKAICTAYCNLSHENYGEVATTVLDQLDSSCLDYIDSHHQGCRELTSKLRSKLKK